MNDELKETTPTPEVPTPTGYTLRIISPVDVVSSLEVRMYGSVDEGREAMEAVGSKLFRNGIKEFEIHLTDATNDGVVQTLRRVVTGETQCLS